MRISLATQNCLIRVFRLVSGILFGRLVVWLLVRVPFVRGWRVVVLASRSADSTPVGGEFLFGYCSDARTRPVIIGPILVKNEAFTFRPRERLPVTETIARRQGSSQKPPEQLSELLVKLPGVTTGTRFGGEAFFFLKRFFCHVHATRERLFLETFVWHNVEAVVSEVPGTTPHPEYGGYGWVRLPIDSDDAASRGMQL